MKVRASNILWDLDSDDVDVDLPNEVTIDVNGKNYHEATVDYLSDKYGFCVIALNIEKVA